MAINKNSALFAVRNVASHGDTDVFPFPLENHWFHDPEDTVTELLMELDAKFDDWLRSYPVTPLKKDPRPPIRFSGKARQA